MIDRIREAIRPEPVDGWLFHNFHHRDPLSDEILGLNPASVCSRRWFYAVPREGEPLKIVHAIEKGALDSLPGTLRVYSSLAELKAILSGSLRGNWACHVSETLPIISFLDAGTRDLLSSCGLSCVSADSLVQRLKGLLDPAAAASHEEAGRHLYSIVREVWAGVQRAFSAEEALTEGKIRQWILSGMAERRMVTDHPPIVAAGADSADPHYDFEGQGRTLRRGEVLQLDLWAKLDRPASVYADISWVGIYDDAVPPALAKRASDLFAARDLAVSSIAERRARGEAVRGAEVDELVRASLERGGYGDALRHRTGHGIDTECHGSGVNLDCVEFPDRRLLLDGSCFSVEPGIYFDDYGLRTEIDVRMEAGRPVVTGGEPQKILLYCSGAPHAR